MKTFRYLLIALALSIIACIPRLAYSLEHIPFYATNNTGIDFGICCIGPWYRDNTNGNLVAGADDFNFYTIDVDIFSPYGKWTCGQWGFMPSVCNSVDILVQPIVTFTLEKGDTAVYLTVTDDSITVSMASDSDTSTTQARLAEESDTSTTQAALGDDNTKPKRDRDTWSIQGTEGETVTVTLEEDSSAGHSGEQATLILKNGGSTIETITDVLPIETTTTLPSVGEYQLVVEQHNIPEDVRFRGRYFLSVKSSLGNVQDIKPSEDVEQ